MKDLAFVTLLCCLHLSALQVAETHLFKKAENNEYQFGDIDDMKCGGMFCHAGQECTVSRDGNALCVCISSCPQHSKPVCGSDHTSYDNHCELHRTACLEERRISVESDGLCKGPPTSSVVTDGKVKMSKPVVCYEKNRDQMRSRLIEWLRAGDGERESGEQNFLRKYFDSMDKNKDGTLDINEFVELIKSNQSISEVLDSGDDLRPILQSLCAEAVIAISDADSDWKLDFDEFATCLDPNFKPSGRGCELENTLYHDGAEIPTECNSCVCACGHWVCTVLKCESEEENNMEGSEGEPNKTQFVVEGSEATNKLMQGTAETRNKDGGQKGRVLPLLKTRHHHNHRNKTRKQHNDNEQE